MKQFLKCYEINEKASTHFIKMFHQFTTEKYDIAIKGNIVIYSERQELTPIL